MSNDSARSLLESIAGYVGASKGDQPQAQRPIRLAAIDATYDGTDLPRVRFEGETTTGLRTYVYTGAKPAAGDRVAMLPVGGTYVILGPIEGQLETRLELLEARPLAETAKTSGIASTSGTAGGSSSVIYWDTGTTVTFPVGLFSTKPEVKVDIEMGGGVAWVDLISVSATAFSARVMRIGASPASYPLHWRAAKVVS